MATPSHDDGQISQDQLEAQIARVKKSRQRLAIDQLDYQRGVAALSESLNQTQISKHLGISQPSIHNTLQKAKNAPKVREGFSGATPYEIAQRFAIGELDRDQLIDQLSRWPYATEGHTDGYDSLIVNPPGTFNEVVHATYDGLIDNQTYGAILNRFKELAG